LSRCLRQGVKSSRYAVSKRIVGSCSERSNTIRINRVLDKKTVPRYYVALIVYHEMLHPAMGTPLRGKRRSVHSGEFRKREKLFRDYENVMAWEGGKA
jgi:predicted metal-dependent hydrolase